MRSGRILEASHLLIPFRISLPTNDDGGALAGHALQPGGQSQHGLDWLGEENDLFLPGRLKNVAPQTFPFQLAWRTDQTDALPNQGGQRVVVDVAAERVDVLLNVFDIVVGSLAADLGN